MQLLTAPSHSCTTVPAHLPPQLLSTSPTPSSHPEALPCPLIPDLSADGMPLSSSALHSFDCSPTPSLCPLTPQTPTQVCWVHIQGRDALLLGT